MEKTLKTAEKLFRDAASSGADLITLPEFFSCLSIEKSGLNTNPHTEDEHPALKRFQMLSEELKVWTLLGSITIQANNDRFFNRSYILNTSGEIISRYSKIHLFDVDLDKSQIYRESDQVMPGDQAVLASIPWGTIGMSICYDIRFPNFYRTLAKAGANIITIPAAFTKRTGIAHWHVLNRARAIECSSFVISPCMPGKHGIGRTFGHSLIVSPWGEILADGGEEEGFVKAEINMDEVINARKMIPSLEHDRNYSISIDS